MQSTESNHVYSFSYSRADILFGKYYYLVALFGWFFIMLLEVFYDVINRTSTDFRLPIVSVTLVLPILLFLCLVIYLILFRSAFSFVYDYNDESLILFIFRKKKPIIYSISDLEVIKINWHTTFIFLDGRKYWIKSHPNLIEYIMAQSFNREWGYFGKKVKKEWETGRPESAG